MNKKFWGLLFLVSQIKIKWLKGRRKSNRKTIYRSWAVTLLLLTLLLGACGEDNTPTAKPTTGPNPTTVAATPAAANSAAATSVANTAPASSPNAASTSTAGATAPLAAGPTVTPVAGLRDDEQVLNLTSGDLESFDPALASEVETSFVLRQIYSGLVTLDKDLKVVPDLAAKLPDIGEQGTLYTFTLRPGLKFQSGREVTAEDLRFSMERASDAKLAAPDPASSLPAANYMNDIVGFKDKIEGRASQISGISVKDNYTLQIKLDAAKPYFLAKMTYNVFFVVNPDAVAKGFDPPDGTGPFKLLEYKPDQFLRLVRNPLYYNRQAYLSRINFALGANAANGLVQYEQGRQDIMGIGGSAVERALDKTSQLNKELITKPELSLSYLGFNTRARPFDELKVRQAFAAVLDKAKIAKVLYEGRVQSAVTVLPPGMPGYTGNPGPLTYDINHARDLIAQSSYRTAANLPKIVVYSTGGGLAKVLKDVYKQAFDIDIEVQQYDYKDFQSGLNQRQFQMYIYGWTADYPDPENFLRTLLGSGSPFNNSGYNNPNYDDLLKQGDQQSDTQKRLDSYGKAEQIALNDVPILPITHGVSYLLVKPYVKGLELTAIGLWSLKDVYISKK